jgi:hypothetical protein
MTTKIKENPTGQGSVAGVPGAGAPNGPQEWKVCRETGVAPKSILAKCGHYKVSYHIYWVTGNKLCFWYSKVFYNKQEIGEFSSVQELENFILQRGLPSIKGLPYLGGETK